MRRLFSRWTVLAAVLGFSVALGCTFFRRLSLRPPDNLTADQKSLYVANVYAKLGNWEAAGPIFAQLEKRFHDLGDARNELYAHVSWLRTQEEVSDLQRLSEDLRQILQRPDVQNDLELKQRVLEVKGNVDLNFDGLSARGPLEELHRVATQRHDSDAASRANGELGIVAFLDANPSDAKRRVLWAIAESYAHGDQGAKIRYLSMLGQGLADHGRPAESLWFLNRAVSVAADTEGAGFPKIAMTGKAAALTQLHRYGEAAKVIEDGLRFATQHGYVGYEVDMLSQKGQLTAEQNDIPGAIRLLERAATLAQQIHFDRGAAQVNAQLATFYKRAGNLPRAEIAARRCIDAHRAMQEVYEIPHHLAVQASIQAATGKRRVARETFETAELVVSTMLRNSPTVAVKTSVLSSMSEVFSGHFELEVAAGNVAGAYAVIEKARGRIAADRLRLGEASSRSKTQIIADGRRLASLQLRLLDAESPKDRQTITDLVTQAESQAGAEPDEPLLSPAGEPPSLSDLQTALHPNEVVLEYVLGDNASFCLTVRRKGVTVARLPSRKTIDNLTERYLLAVKQGNPARAEAAKLYEAVLKPIPETSEGIIVVPDGSLHRIPFGALVTPDTGQFLVEAHVVSYTPSGAVLTLERKRATQDREQLLAVGGVSYNKDAPPKWRGIIPWPLFRGLDSLRRDQLHELPGTVDEVRMVRGTLNELKPVVLSGA